MTPQEDVITSMAAIVANQTHSPRDELLSHLSDPSTAVRLAEISGPVSAVECAVRDSSRSSTAAENEPGST